MSCKLTSREAPAEARKMAILALAFFSVDMVTIACEGVRVFVYVLVRKLERERENMHESEGVAMYSVCTK